MTEEEIDEDDNHTTWIQMLIVAALIAAAAVATYYRGFYVNRQELPEFAAVVRHTPVYGVIRGDTDTDYVDFQLKGGKKFRLTECVCHATRKSITTSLVRGDTILIRATDTFINDHEYDVYSIASPQYGAILTTDESQRCYRYSMWFVIIFGTPFIAMAIAATIVKLRDDREEKNRK